jgi:hypothetical protein
VEQLTVIDDQKRDGHQPEDERKPCRELESGAQSFGFNSGVRDERPESDSSSTVHPDILRIDRVTVAFDDENYGSPLSPGRDSRLGSAEEGRRSLSDRTITLGGGFLDIHLEVDQNSSEELSNRVLGSHDLPADDANSLVCRKSDQSPVSHSCEVPRSPAATERLTSSPPIAFLDPPLEAFVPVASKPIPAPPVHSTPILEIETSAATALTPSVPLLLPNNPLLCLDINPAACLGQAEVVSPRPDDEQLTPRADVIKVEQSHSPSLPMSIEEQRPLRDTHDASGFTVKKPVDPSDDENYPEVSGAKVRLLKKSAVLSKPAQPPGERQRRKRRIADPPVPPNGDPAVLQHLSGPRRLQLSLNELGARFSGREEVIDDHGADLRPPTPASRQKTRNALQMNATEVSAFRSDVDLNGTFMTASMATVTTEPQKIRWV